MDLPPEGAEQQPPDLDEQDLETLLGTPADAKALDPMDDSGPPSRHRSRYLPAILDALIPGLGHLVVGRWQRAVLFVSPLLLGLLTAAWIVTTTSRPRLAASLLSNEVILALLAAQGLLLASRLIAVGSSLYDPALSRPGRRDLLPIALLLVFIMAPQAYAGYATEVAREAANEIFVEPPAAVVPTVSAAPDPSFLSTPPPGLPSPSPSLAPGGSQRITALVIGVDSGVGRNTYLTDTMIIVSLDRATRTVSMLSIPRDMVDVPMADGRTYRDKINSLVAYARHHPEQFPGSNGTGFDVLMGALATLTQIPIDYYAKVDLGGFVRVVDVLGGVNVNVAHGFCDPGYDEYGFSNGFSITAGLHHLNGQQALAYARVRKASGESDFTRAARQQEVISGIRDSIVHGGFLNDPIGLLQAVGKTVETNVPRDLLPDLADLATEVGREQTYRAVVTHPLVGSGFDIRGSIQIPDVPAIRALAAILFPTDGSLPSADYGLPKPSGAAASGSGVGGCNPAPKPKPTPTPKPKPTPTPTPTPKPTPSPGRPASRPRPRRRAAARIPRHRLTRYLSRPRRPDTQARGCAARRWPGGAALRGTGRAAWRSAALAAPGSRTCSAHGAGRWGLPRLQKRKQRAAGEASLGFRCLSDPVPYAGRRVPCLEPDWQPGRPAEAPRVGTLSSIRRHSLLQQLRQLLPLDQERVVALGRPDLAVAGAHAGGARGPDQFLDLARPVQDVALDPDPRQRDARATERVEGANQPAVRPPDIVAVHGLDQDPVRRWVEPVDQLVALVVEVADHRRSAVGLDRATEALGKVGLAPIGGHRQLAGERQALEAEMLDELELEMVPGDRQRADRRRGSDRGHVAGRLRPGQRDLERHHPAERAAGRQRDLLDAELVEQAPLGAGLVHRGDRREARPVRPARPWMQGGRPAGAIAATEEVRAQHANLGRVECPALADQRLPPVARRVRRSSERVDHEDLRRGIGRRAVVAVGDDQVGERRCRSRA